jgi:hypothetical protein
MSSGRLCAENLSIAKAILSRGIVHAMERGERDESRLAMYAVNTFNTYSDGIICILQRRASKSTARIPA